MAEKGEGRFDFELSIDETATPTTPQAHVFMARESSRRGVAISSLAPRFVGEFQKGIDYIGDVGEFEASFAVHAALCRSLGHRISVHSGSDKFSVFPAIGRLSRGRFHVKTAGTSWLEALRVVAAADPALFRDLYAHARRTYDNARKLYHVTPDLSRLPDPAGLPAAAAAALLDDRDARQVLHITYGEMLAVPDAEAPPVRRARRLGRRLRGRARAAHRPAPRVPGRAAAPVSTLLVLDFDGVICDSVEECFVSSWEARFRLRGGTGPMPEPPADGLAAFARLQAVRAQRRGLPRDPRGRRAGHRGERPGGVRRARGGHRRRRCCGISRPASTRRGSASSPRNAAGGCA